MTSKERMSHKGSICYNNGEMNKLFYPGDVIPEGFVKGKIGHYDHPWRKGLTKDDPRIQASEKTRLASRVYGPLNDEYKRKLSEAAIASLPKLYETKNKNKSWNTSKSEDAYYLELLSIYDEDDIIRPYRDDRYPFNCDFYIKSLDLFIEYNGTWTHGDEPFDNKNSLHLLILNLLEEKYRLTNSKYYKNAIDTWTKRDVLKLETFRKNNLNFLIIYPKSSLIITE